MKRKAARTNNPQYQLSRNASESVISNTEARFEKERQNLESY